ncbi:MAG: electron transfer flavoprotein subunit alpha/FixB family protein [Synergistaceae bacterium]|jgi:electron transfer flavoprotein alpha subunit|nr:electron transfer flavoprotein subunit alpha/FixB family protein [Synergistaceae bacterium]
MTRSDRPEAGEFSNEVWVLGEDRPCGEISSVTFELSAKARELSDALSSNTGERHRVTALLLIDSNKTNKSNRSKPQDAGYYGADRVLAAKAENLPFDRAACARILAHLAQESRPKIIIASATAFGRSVMPYAAALLGTGLTADCTGLSIEPGTNLLLQTRPAIGGNIMATIKTPNHMPQMATARPGTFSIPAPNPEKTAEVLYPDLPDGLFSAGVSTIKFDKFTRDERTLQDRNVIVSGGRGLRRAEGFELISALASLLDAGVGASRPVVEMKWIGYPHQVGLSGQVVSPKVYIAAGISGTVQHIAGMQTAGKIISINRDPEAQIFNVSDVAICGDLYEIIPKLIERIKAKRGRK